VSGIEAWNHLRVRSRPVRPARFRQRAPASYRHEAELARRQAARPKALTPAQRDAILALGDDLGQVWDAPTTTDKDRKQLLRTLLEKVNITARHDDADPCSSARRLT
jgi:hypothetical protein